MNESIKPCVIISKCIEFDNCRYNGQRIASNEVKELKPFIEFIPICPEVEIGLGIPRDPIRIVYKNQKKNLIQSKSQRDFTDSMNNFSNNFLDKTKNIDGFILKTRSPSCGIKEVKIYLEDKGGIPSGRSLGFFADVVLKKFPHLAIEDEGRLRNPTIREHFLKKLYVFAGFRAVKNKKSISNLIKFHTENKFLFMAYNQSKLKEMGKVVANAKKYSIDLVISRYEQLLNETFKRSSRCKSNINVLLHSFGYFSDGLSKEEKSYFLNEMERYRQSNISLASVIEILKSWIIRFNEPYLKHQTFFSPYPEQLVHAENIDSCSSKDYWK
jgi:uncharacterized protein YbgA (DUF1722 family)/uncharacterized protein YbbK (DUF523 family)